MEIFCVFKNILYFCSHKIQIMEREEYAYERLQKEIENLLRKYDSEITEEELQNAVTDNIGAKYTQDWSKLIKVPEGLTSYEVKEGTKVIANFAFDSCTQLISVTIPDSVKVIGKGAFLYCFKLQSIVIPNGIGEIRLQVFDHCRSLTSVTIPESVEYIGEYAFAYCSTLKEVNIPNPDLKTIESMAFAGCKSLTDCQYSKTAKLGVGVFLGCESLKNKPVEEFYFEGVRLKHRYKEG